MGAEAFKYRYANAQRTNANLRVFRRRWLYLSTMGFAWVLRIWNHLIRAITIHPRGSSVRDKQS